MPGKTDDGANDKAFPNNPAYKFAGGGILATHSDVVRFGAAHATPRDISAHSEAIAAGFLDRAREVRRPIAIETRRPRPPVQLLNRGR